LQRLADANPLAFELDIMTHPFTTETLFVRNPKPALSLRELSFGFGFLHIAPTVLCKTVSRSVGYSSSIPVRPGEVGAAAGPAEKGPSIRTGVQSLGEGGLHSQAEADPEAGIRGRHKAWQDTC
jgi:hypothetical protein